MSPSLRRSALAAAIPVLLLAAPAAEAKNRKLTCEAGYQWTSDRPGFVAVYTTGRENGNSEPQKLTITSKKAGTVKRTGTKTAEAQVGGGFPLLQASVKAQFQKETTEEVTVTREFKEEITIPAYTRLVWRAGSNVRKLKGVVLEAVPPDFIGPIRPIPGLPSSCRMRIKSHISATIPTFDGTKVTKSRIKRK